jgi:hypothetical protein
MPEEAPVTRTAVSRAGAGRLMAADPSWRVGRKLDRP